MNRRGWFGGIGLGMILAGCAPLGTTPAMREAAQPVPKAVARALLSSEDLQALPASGGRFEADLVRDRIYQALRAERAEGSYQALKAVLAK